MANIIDPTPEQEQAWRDWVASRPDAVRAVAERFPPWKLYRLASTGHRVTVYSLSEDRNGSVTITVDVTGRYNLVSFERRVFGIDPDDLSECDMPGPNEALGSADMPPPEVAKANAEAKERLN